MVMKQNPSSSPSARRSSVRAFALAAGCILLASCGGGGGGSDDGGTEPDPAVWHFRGINAISDAPLVQFYVDDTAVATADYGAATDYKPAHTGERPIKVAIRNASKLETADPGYTDIGDEASYEFDGPTDYTLVAAGTVASPQQFLITGTSREAVEDNKVEYQVINAATGTAGSLGVYITATGASIDAPQLIETLALGAYSDRENLDLEIATGDDEDDGRSTPVVFEVRSGSTVILRSSTLTIAEQTRLLIVVADNAGAAGSSAVKLMVFGGVAAGAGTVFNNTVDPGELKFANTSSDAGALDLILGNDAGDVLAPGIVYGTQSDYQPRPPTLYNAIGTPAGNAGAFYFVDTVTITAGRSYSMYAQGPVSNMRGLLFADDRRSVPTEAHFRFLYTAATEGAKAVAIYLTKRGAELDLDATTPPTPDVASLAYRGISSRLTLDGGSYDAYFTLVGSTDILLGPVPLDLTDGSVQTLALTDNPAGDLELVAFDDARE